MGIIKSVICIITPYPWQRTTQITGLASIYMWAADICRGSPMLTRCYLKGEILQGIFFTQIRLS